MLLPQLVGFVLLPIYSRFLTKDDFATLSIIEVVMTFFSFLAILSLDRVVIKFLSSTNDRDRLRFKKLFVTFAILAPIAWLIVLLVIIFAGSGLIYFSIPIKWLLLGALIGCLRASFQIFIRLLQFDENLKFYVFISCLRSLLDLIFIMVVFIFIAYYGSIVYAMLLSSVIVFFVLLLNIKNNNLDVKVSFSKSDLKDTLIFSFPLLPTVFLAWLVNMSSRYYLGEDNFSEIADFSMAYKISYLIAIFSVAIQVSASKRVYTFLSQGNKHLVQPLVIKCLYILILSTLGLSIFSFFFLDYILGVKYTGVWVYVLTLNLAMFVNGVVGLSSNLLFYHFNKTKLLLIFYLMYTFLVLNLFYYFSSFGVWMICNSILVGSIFLAMLQIKYCCKFNVFNNKFYIVFFIFIAGYTGTCYVFL